METIQTKIGLSVIIVNWNAGWMLKRCVDSVLASEKEPTDEIEIIIVDNASTDESLEKLKGIKRIKIINNNHNLGFAKACNMGAKASGCEYLLFLNPDTRVKEDVIAGALDCLRRNEDIHVLGVKQTDDVGNVARGCTRIPKPGSFISQALGLYRLSSGIFPSFKMHEWDHLESRAVGHVMGSFYMLKKELFHYLGGFDEKFFIYYEDLDFSMRVWQNMGKVYYNAGFEVIHEGGGTSRKVRSRRLMYSVRSRLTFSRKHFQTPQWVMVNTLILFVEPFIRILKSLVMLRFNNAKETIAAYFMLLGSYL